MTPFEWASSHVNLVGWSTVFGVLWYLARFLYRADKVVSKKSQKFDELHLAVTNHLAHAIPEAVDKMAAWHLAVTNAIPEAVDKMAACEDKGHREIAVALEKLGDRLCADGHETRETIRAHFAQMGRN